MTPLPSLATLPAAAARNANASAPADAAVADRDGGDFAAALVIATRPAEPATAAAGAEVASERGDGAVDEAEVGAACDAAAIDLSQWLPGWPSPAAAPTVVSEAHAATAARTQAADVSAVLASNAPGAGEQRLLDKPAPVTPVGAGSESLATLASVKPGGAESAVPIVVSASKEMPCAAAAGPSTSPGRTAIQTRDEQGLIVSAGMLQGLEPRNSPMPNATSHPAAPTVSPEPFESHLAVALDTPAFAPALATQVKWLLREGVPLARLSLNPAELGPLTVQIVLDGTQARVDFSAEIASTRAAIEASLPTLAAALHDSGLTLAGGGVFDGQARQGAPGERSPRTHGSGPNATLPAPEPAPTLPLRAARGLVDLVA